MPCNRNNCACYDRVEDYYRSLGDDERAEDTEWAALADETVRKDWSVAEE